MKNEKYEELYSCFLKTIKIYKSADKKFKIAKVSAVAAGIGTGLLAFVCPPAAIATGVATVAATGYAIDQYKLAETLLDFKHEVEKKETIVALSDLSDLLDDISKNNKEYNKEVDKNKNLIKGDLIERLIIERKSLDKRENLRLDNVEKYKETIGVIGNVAPLHAKDSLEILRQYYEEELKDLEDIREKKAEIDEKLDKEAQKEIEKYIARLKNTEDFVELKKIGDKSVILFEALYKNASTELTAKMKELQEEYSHCYIKLNSKEEYIKAATEFKNAKLKTLLRYQGILLKNNFDKQDYSMIQQKIELLEGQKDSLKSDGPRLALSHILSDLEDEQEEEFGISFVQKLEQIDADGSLGLKDSCQEYFAAIKVLEKIACKYDSSIVGGCGSRSGYMYRTVIGNEENPFDKELYESIKSSLTNKQKETNEEETETEME